MKPSAHELFEILAREHAEMAYTFLRAAGHQPSVAEDLLQESLLVAWRKLETFDRTRSFGPWLRGIAAKLSLAEFRKSVSNKATYVETDKLEHLQFRFSQLDTADGFEFKDKVAVLDNCVQRLSKIERTIVQEKYERKRQLKEIAKMVSLSGEVVKKRLQRARKKLKGCIIRQLECIRLGREAEQSP